MMQRAQILDIIMTQHSRLVRRPTNNLRIQDRRPPSTEQHKRQSNSAGVVVSVWERAWVCARAYRFHTEIYRDMRPVGHPSHSCNV